MRAFGQFHLTVSAQARKETQPTKSLNTAKAEVELAVHEIDAACVNGLIIPKPNAPNRIARSESPESVPSSSRSSGVWWMQGEWMSVIAEASMQ